MVEKMSPDPGFCGGFVFIIFLVLILLLCGGCGFPIWH